MTQDRITGLTIIGMRVVKDLDLKNLNGLTVLIGDNGSGKSTIIEALEILRSASGPEFYEHFYQYHGGLKGMGSDTIYLAVKIEGDGPPLRYGFVISEVDGFARIGKEKLQILSENDQVSLAPIERNWSDSKVLDPAGQRIDLRAFNGAGLELTNPKPRQPHPSLSRVINALANIEVHVPFEVSPEWASRAFNHPSEMRDSTILQPAPKLARLGANLPSVYHALRNDFSQNHWEETMMAIRLGLGDNVEDLGFNVDPAGGRIAIKIKFSGSEQPVPATSLSDGMLAYLALIALYRTNDNRSLLAFDEPDLHLHPQLLVRVIGFFESMAKSYPVIIATHSDRLLDCLSDPANSVVLCQLNSKRETDTFRPDKESLERWLKRYRGFGDIRSEGHLASIIKKDPNN